MSAAVPALQTLVPLLMGFVVVAGGAAWCAYVLARALASRRWPEVSGRVRSSEARRNPQTFRRHAFAIDYEYTVGGRTYRGGRLAFEILPRAFNDREVAELARHYHAGAAVRVRYNPARPGDSVLNPGASPLVLLTAGLVFFVLVLWVRGAWPELIEAL